MKVSCDTIAQIVTSIGLIELSKQKVHACICSFIFYSVTSVRLLLCICYFPSCSALSGTLCISHDRHCDHARAFPVEHPLFKFKSRTRTRFCFVLIHDFCFPPPLSFSFSYWSIQALRAGLSLQFALNPIKHSSHLQT